jgi:hypothetical protein
MIMILCVHRSSKIAPKCTDHKQNIVLEKSCGKTTTTQYKSLLGTHRLDEHHSASVLGVHSIHKPLSDASIDQRNPNGLSHMSQ